IANSPCGSGLAVASVCGLSWTADEWTGDEWTGGSDSTECTAEPAAKSWRQAIIEMLGIAVNHRRSSKGAENVSCFCSFSISDSRPQRLSSQAQTLCISG